MLIKDSLKPFFFLCPSKVYLHGDINKWYGRCGSDNYVANKHVDEFYNLQAFHNFYVKIVNNSSVTFSKMAFILKFIKVYKNHQNSINFLKGTYLKNL